MIDIEDNACKHMDSLTFKHRCKKRFSTLFYYFFKRVLTNFLILLNLPNSYIKRLLRVTGQNGIDQNGTDKMSRTKW